MVTQIMRKVHFAIYFAASAFGRKSRAYHPHLRAHFSQESLLCLTSRLRSADRPGIWIATLASILFTAAISHAQSPPAPGSFPTRRFPLLARQASALRKMPETRDVALIGERRACPRHRRSKLLPQQHQPTPTTPPPSQHRRLRKTRRPPARLAPDLKGQTEPGKEQVEKQEKQRVLGVIPAFNSVYEGTVPPLTPARK